jgi:hypothetical protein
MTGEPILFEDRIPDPEQYISLRKAAGLSEKSIEGARIGLINSRFIVTLYSDEELINCMRHTDSNIQRRNLRGCTFSQ